MDARATTKQVDFLVKLVSERRENPDLEAVRGWAEGSSTREVSAQIERMLAEPKLATAPAAQPAAELEMGMYRKADGTLYRVYPARNGGHLLAKRLVPDGESWSFEYAGAAGRFVRAEERMTLEEAKAWGAQFGTCCVCAALLTDPESVANGIGPICGSRV